MVSKTIRVQIWRPIPHFPLVLIDPSQRTGFRKLNQILIERKIKLFTMLKATFIDEIIY